MSDSASSYKLHIEDDEGRRSVVPVELGEITIGRNEGNTIRLKERNVSRRHAVIRHEHGSIFAVDLNSHNGLWINGNRIQGRVSVREGDLIRIGDFQLELRGEGYVPKAETPLAHKPASDDLTQPHIRMPDARVVPDAMPQQTTPFQTLSSERTPEPVQHRSPVPARSDFERDEPTAIINLAQRDPDAARVKKVDLSPADRPRLICVSTNLAGRDFEITKSEVVIGRTSDNDIAIDHRSVSRHHTKIVVQNRVSRVIDMGSANGTLVNGEHYAELALNHGDLIELGHVKLRYMAPGERYQLTADEKEVVKQAKLSRAESDDVVSPKRKTAALPKASPNRTPLYIMGFVIIVLLVALILMRMPTNDEPKEAVAVEASPQENPPAPTQPDAASPNQPAALDSANDSAQLLQQARQALDQQRWKEASGLAGAVLAREPGQPEARAIKARAEIETHHQGLYQQASDASGRQAWKEAWEALSGIAPTSFYHTQTQGLRASVRQAMFDSVLTKARAEVSSESWDEATQLTDELAAMDESRSEITELRTAINEGRRMSAEANRAAQRKPVPQPSARPKKSGPQAAVPIAPAAEPEVADKLPSLDAKGYYTEGIKILSAGNSDQAINYLMRCIQVDAKFALCYRAMGIAYARTGNAPKAARYYRLYLKVDPNARDAEQVKQLLEQYESAQ